MISVVFPVYNEKPLLQMLYDEISGALQKLDSEYEMICVDDGSTDGTWEKGKEIHASDKRFKVLSLSRNFGHQAAFTAGLQYARGDWVVMLDGDLQDPPSLIPEMWRKAKEENLDVVYGRRTSRSEERFRRWSTKLFHRIFKRFSSQGGQGDVGNFALLSRKATDALLSLDERSRYLPGLRIFIGFNQGYVEYDRPARTKGKTKMSFSRMLNLAMDAIFSFSNLPIRICLFLGFAGIFLFLAALAYTLLSKFTGLAPPGWSSTMLSIYFFGSVQLLFLGIIGEYIYRIYRESQKRPHFLVREFLED
jgi:dolichol-phosphate mannosyltransferase